MESLIEIIGALTDQPLYFYSLIFLVFLFLGEPIVLAASIILVSNNIISFLEIIFIAYFSALIAEMIWFYIGRFHFIQKIFLTDKILKTEQLITRMKIHRPITLLFITRLFSGLTIAAILYLSAKKISLRYFLICSSVVNAFWTPMIVSIGYLTGHGYMYAAELFSTIHLAGALTIILLIIFYICRKAVYRHFLSEVSIDHK